MNRRNFVQAITAAGVGIAAAPRNALASRRLDRIGLELYSIRKAMAADPDRTLAAVRAIGYTDVELLWSFGNFGRTAQQVRDVLITLDGAFAKAKTDWSRVVKLSLLLQRGSNTDSVKQILTQAKRLAVPEIGFTFVEVSPARNICCRSFRIFAEQWKEAASSSRAETSSGLGIIRNTERT